MWSKRYDSCLGISVYSFHAFYGEPLSFKREVNSNWDFWSVIYSQNNWALDVKPVGNTDHSIKAKFDLGRKKDGS